MFQESEDAGALLPVLNFVKLIISKGMVDSQAAVPEKRKEEKEIKKGKQNQKEASQKTLASAFYLGFLHFSPVSFFFLTCSLCNSLALKADESQAIIHSFYI